MPSQGTSEGVPALRNLERRDYIEWKEKGLEVLFNDGTRDFFTVEILLWRPHDFSNLLPLTIYFLGSYTRR